MPRHFRIKDEGIFCTSCITTIEVAIKSISNASSFTYELNVDNKSLTLHVLVDEVEQIKNDIKQATQAVGFFYDDCVWEETDALGQPLVKSISPDPSEVSGKNTITNHLIKGLPSIVIGALWVSLPFFPIGSAILLGAIMLGLSIISSLMIGYAGWEIFARAFTAAKRKRITMDTQFTVSVLIAFIISWVAFGITGLPFLFDAALLILGFRHVGLAIEEWAKRKIDAGNSLLDGLPKIVDVMVEGVRDEKIQPIRKATESLMSGDKITIPAGTTIPTDGICISEQAIVMAPDLSGQTDSFSVQKTQKLLQGYKVISGVVDVYVEKPMLQSTLACMQHQAKIAATKRMNSVSETTQIGANFVKGIFIITFLSFGFVMFYCSVILGVATGVALILALKTALGVLVAACPCTFGSIIPLIGKVGTYKCLKNGATLLNANVLDNAAKAKYAVFDLNGTLTTGEKIIHNIVLFDQKTDKNPLPNKIHAYLKFLEKDSKHLTGQAIYSYLDKRHPTEILNETEMAGLEVIDYGMGLGIKVDGQQLIVGSKDLLGEKIFFNPRDFPILPYMTQRNYIAYGDSIIGYIDIVEAIRPEAFEVVQYFRAQGIKVKLCTGAHRDSAMSYAQMLGFTPEDVKAGYSIKPTPEAKAQKTVDDDSEVKRKVKEHPKATYIKSLQEHGWVIFVGDAGNDNLPIAEAAVGVVVDSPTMSEANKTGANVYIGQRSLWPLVKMHAIAKQTMFNIKLSLSVSVLYNLVSFAFMGGLALLWLGFMMNPGLGVAMMVGQAFIILIFAAVFQIWPVPNNDQYPRKISETEQRFLTDAINPIPHFYNSSTLTRKSISVDDSKNSVEEQETERDERLTDIARLVPCPDKTTVKENPITRESVYTGLT